MQFLKRLNSGRVYASLSVAILLLSYNNCSRVAFESVPAPLEVIEESSVTPESTPSPVPGDPIVSVYKATVNFPQETALPVDMVWVIDNSQSMVDEAAHVRSNVESFIDYIKERTDLKLALISDDEQTSRYNTGVDLPSASNLLQVVREVASNNLAQLLASALCVAGNNAPQSCKDSMISQDSSIRGTLVNFFRPGARKAFIFVTDDKSDMTSTNFFSVVNATLPGQSVTVSGFVGLGRGVNDLPSPCQEKTGVQYQEMAAATAGSIFNVCDADWKASFSQLAQQTVLDATRPISIPADVRTATIRSVLLNGSVVPSTMWRITDAGLIIDTILTKGLSIGSVTIEYIKK